MTTYAIGDVQGCFLALKTLLDKIQFNPRQDTLWFTGDLVNRGPQSLEVLRFVQSLGGHQKIVLGNHDLHLLAVHYGIHPLHSKDTLQPILDAPDREKLIDWLRHQPLLHAEANYVMVHAGLAPWWTLSKAQALAKEVESVLQSDHPADFLAQMYGNEPNAWDEALTGMARLRCITNYFTRMRFCDVKGRLDLTYKGTIAQKPAELMPWYSVPGRVNQALNIIFGHWAALNGESETPGIFPLDTGCVWGNCLTALRLTDQKRFQVDCR